MSHLQYSYANDSHLDPIHISDADHPHTDRSTDSNLFRPTSMQKWSTSALVDHEREMKDALRKMGADVPSYKNAYSDSYEEDQSVETEETSSSGGHHPHRGKQLTLNVSNADHEGKTQGKTLGFVDEETKEADSSDSEDSYQESPTVPTTAGVDWRVGDTCVLQRMPKPEYEGQTGRLIEYLPQKRKWRVLLIMGKGNKVIVIVPKSNLKHPSGFADASLSRSVQSSVTVTPRQSKTADHIKSRIPNSHVQVTHQHISPRQSKLAAIESRIPNQSNIQQPPEVSDTEFNQLVHLLHELKNDVARMKQNTTVKVKRVPKSTRAKSSRSRSTKREPKAKSSHRRQKDKKHRSRKHRHEHRSSSRHRRKPRKKRRLPEETPPFFGGAPLPSYAPPMGPPIPPPHMAAGPMPMYGPGPSYGDPYGYPANPPMVDPYYPTQHMPMQYQPPLYPPPEPMYAPPPPQPMYGPPPPQPQYRPPPGPPPGPAPVPHHMPPPAHFQSPPAHFQPPPRRHSPPSRRGHSEMRPPSKRRQKSHHKRSATHGGGNFNNLQVKDLDKEYRARSSEPAPRKKSKTPDYYETLKGDKGESMPMSRTKPKPNANHIPMEPNESKRKVEFQEHPPVPHYYEDRQNHGRDAERSHDMHHLMADTKLSDFNASHHHEEHHLQEEHHMHEENRSHAVSREVSHASHVMPREASHHAAPRQVSRHPSREISHHPPRQVSHQLSHDYRQQSHVDYTDHNKAAGDRYNRASKMYFLDDEHYIERMKTIEQEKYLVQGDDVAGHPGGGFDARQAARYPSYASSNPYIGTLPDDNYTSRRGPEAGYVAKKGHAVE